MSTAAFLDQDFGAESDDDATFNPAPGDESDNDPGEESDGTPPPDQDAKGRKLSGQGGNDLAAAQSIPAQEAASNDDETSNDASRGGRSQKKGKVRKATEAANGDGDDLAGDYEDGEEQTVNEGGDEKAEVDDDEQEADEDEDADEEEDDEAEEDEEDEEEDEDEDEEELKVGVDLGRLIPCEMAESCVGTSRATAASGAEIDVCKVSSMSRLRSRTRKRRSMTKRTSYERATGSSPTPIRTILPTSLLAATLTIAVTESSTAAAKSKPASMRNGRPRSSGNDTVAIAPRRRTRSSSPRGCSCPASTTRASGASSANPERSGTSCSAS